MTKVTYEIAEHDGGWAYRVDGAWSETFATREAASHAAKRAAREQRIPGEDTSILYADRNGRWHEEIAHGNDRPEPDVKG